MCHRSHLLKHLLISDIFLFSYNYTAGHLEGVATKMMAALWFFSSSCGGFFGDSVPILSFFLSTSSFIHFGLLWISWHFVFYSLLPAMDFLCETHGKIDFAIQFLLFSVLTSSSWFTYCNNLCSKSGKQSLNYYNK